MKQLIVTAFARHEGKSTPRGVRMHATLNNGKLTTEGATPPGVALVFPKDLTTLGAEDAEFWFYLLAGTKYPGRSRVEFIGTSREDVVDYLTANLTEDELIRVMKGIPIQGQSS